MPAAASVAAVTGSESSGRLIPHEVLLCNILPWLSFKSLCSFKCVCKEWRRIISCDPGFALEQSRRPSPTSSGVVYNGTDRLVFFPTFGSPIGVPRPSVYHSESSTLVISASTNGLLCCNYASTRSLYVCNPATGKAAIIPNSVCRLQRGIGLAFDPSISPDRFKIVRSMVALCGRNTDEYSFDVFSSDTGEWMSSSQKVYNLECGGSPGKAVFARGILYWDCRQHLVWFDPDRDTAGRTMMPPGGSSPYMNIGVWEGQVTCARASDYSGLEVWVMGECGGWEMRHQLGWNPDYFADLVGTKEPTRTRIIDGQIAPFEGGERAYIVVQVPEVKMLCFDLKTGEATCSDLGGEMQWFDGIYGYHNSMVDVPKPLGGDGGGHNHA